MSSKIDETSDEKVTKLLHEINSLPQSSKNRLLSEISLSTHIKPPLDTIFRQADENKDGVISKQEFDKYFISSRYLVPPSFSSDSCEQKGAPATAQQLRLVMLRTGLPFVGFGFLDNFLMLTAGEFIEVQLGSFFVISTLGAAGLGNTFSDVAGLGLGGAIDTLSSKLGIPNPNLTRYQKALPQVKHCRIAATAVGITVGCLLGMFPLLFMKNDAPKERSL